MPAPFDDISALNRLVHEPARLAILTALSVCERADFTFLQSLTGLTKGNLSSHLSKLEQAHLVTIEKTFEGRQPVTYIRLTPMGRERLEEHWERLETIRRASRRLKPLRAS